MESCFSTDWNEREGEGVGGWVWVIRGQMEKRGREGGRVKEWRVVMESGVGSENHCVFKIMSHLLPLSSQV